MLVFVIPLKSQQVSKDWDNVCQLFDRCLRSICQQTDANFRVVVVCHEKPDIQFTHPQVDYVQVDFPTPNQDYRDKMRDRGKKVIVGVIYAQRFSAHHMMIVDADDCLNRRVAEFTNQHPDVNGWVFQKGYVYQENSSFIYYRKSHFYSWCATCNILKFDLCPLPSKDDEYPDDLITYYNGHGQMAAVMQEKGLPLEDFPFAGTVYIIGNGENIYQGGFSTLHNANKGKILFFIKELLKFRPITPAIKQEFGLYKLSA
ncbi:glycosyltransferase family 2 protein [Nostoc sp. TCL26-01]|uniref:glycosyltransferase family 2 protein n=1 Tax=Nostoc sp. TCL26-01 TaxID=2576904 RepID=UPI0015BAE1AF|nr:glycosyltransferase family 2 protein [Nostoc sp. TCL26-01]QLE58536.1 glycosyltransferase family 2 protein [Nostoc sp. TCL26-01]